MSHHTNIVRIKAVSNALNDLKEKVVFVGGATISLYPDRAVFEVRPTDDIDVIIEILNYVDRAKLEERLRSIGFSHDLESGVIFDIKHKELLWILCQQMILQLDLPIFGIQKVSKKLSIMRLTKEML